MHAPTSCRMTGTKFMPANYITWGNISGEYFYAGIGGERVAPLRARAGGIHRQAPDFWGFGSREMVISLVGKWSLQPWPRTQPRLIREGPGAEHSPSVRMSMPSQRPRFLGSLAKTVGALKSVPPPRTRLMSGLEPFFHSTMSLSATV